MSILLNVAIVSVTCIAMEVVAWAIHKYVMHTWAWSWHKSHHEHHQGVFEKNDLFALIFALTCIALMLAATLGAEYLYWVSIGMLVYGLMYFVVHDGFTHRRWPMKWLPRHGYLKRLVQAHRLHHAVEGRTGGVCFGFLYAPPIKKLVVSKSTLRRARARAEGNPEVSSR